MTHEPFVIEHSYNAPVARVWQALTDKEQMKDWYFNMAEFEPTAGFEFTFTGENEGKVYVHRCKIIEAVPNERLKHTWAYEGYDGTSYVTFELTPESEGTRLRLTHEGLETFPPLPDFKPENFAAGWAYILGTSLKDHLKTTGNG